MLLFVSYAFGQSEKVFSFDESQEEIEVGKDERSFDIRKIDEYRLRDAFEYEEAQYEENQWMRFFRQLKERFFSSINASIESKTVQYILIGLMILGISWFLLRTNTNKFIHKANENPNRYVEELDIRVDENILLNRLSQAENEEKWREAIRFAYLLNLKAMNAKDKIIWKEYKLSSDYLQELKDENLKSAFASMTSYFNYSWYGKRTLEKAMYEEVKTQYQGLDSLINKS